MAGRFYFLFLFFACCNVYGQIGPLLDATGEWKRADSLNKTLHVKTVTGITHYFNGIEQTERLSKAEYSSEGVFIRNVSRGKHDYEDSVILIRTFMPNGLILSDVTYYNGSESTKSTYVYDTMNSCLHVLMHTMDATDAGSLKVSSDTFCFDINGRIIERRGTMKLVSGNKLTMQFFDSVAQSIQHVYTWKDKLLVEETIFSNGDTTHMSYSYNRKGWLISVSSLHDGENNAIKDERSFKYYKNGLCKEVISHGKGGDKKLTTSYKYSFYK